MNLSIKRPASGLLFCLILIAVAACQSTPVPERVTQIVQIKVSATPQALLPAATASASPRATVTPTPTATALPIEVSGDPWPDAVLEPIAQSAAPCGFVDYLDFPIDPPHGELASGGADFGRYRSRYEKFHAGEDWGYSGWNNLGRPVYSIGHGWVTYAEPLGWGPDGGTLIIQHVLRSGETIYAFYGHLDPDSLLFRAGDCVGRGTEIALIGKPRTAAHLHFEIRYHLPWTPGPGYWATDPVAAGWLPPSDVIWRSRLAAMAGVEWSIGLEAMSVQLLGLWNEAELLLLEGSAVVSRDPTDGELRWRLPLNPATERAVLVADLLYKVDSFGKITAYVAPTDLYPDASDEEPFDMIWEIESGATGAPLLAALPAGGILAAFPDRQLAISDGGRVLWSEHEPGRPDQLINAAGRLYAAMPNGLVYEIAAAGMSPLGKALGDLYSVHDDLLIYALEGIYRLDLDGTRPAELLSPLPEGFRAGQIAALPGGGYAATHHQAGGDRLLVFNSGGGLRWERSLTNLPGSSTQLISGPLGAYMLTSDSRDESGQVRLYRIVPEEAALDLVFVAGSRRHLASADWISVLPQGQFLIAIGGGDLVRWDPAAALITVNEG